MADAPNEVPTIRESGNVRRARGIAIRISASIAGACDALRDV